MPDDHDELPDSRAEFLHESPLDPATDARVRRLLADARHDEPMPADVVARLDRVLDGLATERAPAAPVVELARRRRTAAKLLVAAAAVVVAGVGVGQVLPNLGGSGGSDTQETSAGGAAADQAAPEAAPLDGDSSSRTASSGAAEPNPANAARIRSNHFGPDVRRIRDGLDDGDAKNFSAAPGASCLVAPVGPGTVLAATYDAAAAALVLRPPTGDTQVVDLYLCGQDTPLRSITLTTP
jgi:hypothetical protein